MSWTPPTPLGDTTGYIIYYTNDDNTDSGNVTIDNSSTDEYTMTGLQNGETYNISIIATSRHFPSETIGGIIVILYPGMDYMDNVSFYINMYIYIPLVPDSPTINTAGTTTATTITISWTNNNPMVTSYEVMWERDYIGGCYGGSDMDSTTITDGSTSYDITELEEDSTYSITVTASNSAGSSVVSNTVTAMTMEAGER